MLRKIISLLAIMACCLTGCFENRPSIKTGDKESNTPAGMIEYLQNANPPALKSVEIWQSDYGPGLKLITDHYEIFTTLLEPLMLRQFPGFVESAYRGYNSQLPESIETSSRFVIYLFAEREQWEDFTKTFAGRQAPLYVKIKAGAYYLNGVSVAYNIGRERTFSALGHEGWHQFNSRHFKFRLPSWLDEGVAMLFEVSRYRRGLFDFEPGRNLNRLGALRVALTENKTIPLRKVVAMNPGEVIAVDKGEALMTFYAQAYALVRFLREDGYGKRLANYQKLLLGGLRGDWPLSEAGQRIVANRNIPLTVGWNREVGPLLFKYYIDEDLGQIEKEYLAFCRKIVYHVRVRKKR